MGYAPPPGLGSDYLHHPLHRVYARKLRWVRLRWLFGGLLLGGLLAFALIILLSALVYTRIPRASQGLFGGSDMVLTITEGYLNREATARLAGGYDTGVPGLTLRSAQIDLGPENRMDLRAEFHLDAPVIQLDLSVGVKNQVASREGRLVVSMVGDPQIGNLNLPLDLLPGNFKDVLKGAVDRVNNTVLATELNQPLETATGGEGLSVDGVTTTETGMTVYLRQR